MTSKLTGEQHNLELTRNGLMKHVELEKPITFLDQVYSGCTQRECEPNKGLVDDCRKDVRIMNFRRCT